VREGGAISVLYNCEGGAIYVCKPVPEIGGQSDQPQGGGEPGWTVCKSHVFFF
jgi:hypothetical protein